MTTLEKLERIQDALERIIEVLERYGRKKK